MKKTFVLAAIALCSASFALADYTLSATPDIPTGAGITTGSAWQGFIMDFNDAVFREADSAVNPGDYSSLTLTSLSVLSHGATGKIDDVYFAIYEVDTSAASSADFTYTLVGQSALGVMGDVTFEFGSITSTTGGDLTLSSTGVYAFLSKNKGTTAVASGTLTDIVSNTSGWTKRYGIINASETDGLTGHNYAIANTALTADRTGNVSYSFTATSAIPEPATATLSLLALAGLAARRRRL